MKWILFIVLIALLASCISSKKNASAKQLPFSFGDKKIFSYTTAANTNYRLSYTSESVFADLNQPQETQICVFVDPAKSYQTFLGVGAAMTDASAETFYKLPKDKQSELLKSYFDKKDGIGYTIMRTNINSCDFSSDMYTYVNEGDQDLTTFDISHDKKFKIPFIKEAMNVAGKDITLFASPWSPPSWMKTNNNMLKGGKLLPAFASSWALYYTKFIKAYEAEGIPVWGITVQNEPMATQIWESCIYTAEEERDFLKNYLGPTMHKEGLSNKKIIVWDHNRDLMYQRAQTYFSDPEASKYAWGIGFHWYENWSGGESMFQNVDMVHKAFPDKNILFTEGCIEKFDASKYASWALGERYGRSMINDFNNGTVGWTDWNILLDETGGPNHVGNFCFAPVHADTKTGQLVYTNSYYYIGHFSKFVMPGAKRISSSASRSQLITTSFLNPDGSIAVIVMNQTEINTPFFIWINGKAAQVTALPHSMNTYLIK